VTYLKNGLITQERINQAIHCAEALGDKVYSEFPWHHGVEPVSIERHELILNRTWRPALTVPGADGFPSIADAGNVMRPITSLKLSMRIPPLVNPLDAAAVLQKVLRTNPLYNAKVSFQVDDGSKGWNAPESSQWLIKAVDEASMLTKPQ